jgi:uncharacterized protein (DUF2384 family)
LNLRQKSYIYATKVGIMKKKTHKSKITKYNNDVSLSKAEEPQAVYFNKSLKTLPSLKEFTYKEFKKIADKAPFTQTEWATILHVSERTLQRYAKSNSTFAPINAERALLVAKAIKEGIETFGTVDLFYGWLKRNPYMLEGNLSFESLTTTEGIQKVMIQLGRIQHGILA